MTDSNEQRQTSLTLLERIRCNDADAWKRLVHIYSPLIYHWCKRWGIHRADAEDLLQEVFHAVSTHLEQFRRDRPGDTFRGWLRGITRNKLLLHFRKIGQQPQATGGSDALVILQQIADDAIPEDDDPPEEISALYQRACDLVRSEFTEKTWLMFWRTAVDGRSPVDVAADQGVSAAAVRKAKSRVLRRLKEEVGDLIH